MNQTPPAGNNAQIMLQLEGSNDPIAITERSALTLIRLIDMISIKGAGLKVAVGLAQTELETSLQRLAQHRQEHAHIADPEAETEPEQGAAADPGNGTASVTEAPATALE